MSERTLITTRAEFDTALRQAFALNAEQGGRELLLCDEDFTAWPLGDRDVLEQLTRWTRPHRRLTIVARHFDAVVRRQPRFVDWRQLWSHVIDCRSPEPQDVEALPTLFLAPGLTLVRLSDPRLPRGIASTEPAELLRAREHFDAIAQRGTPSFPAGVLGL